MLVSPLVPGKCTEQLLGTSGNTLTTETTAAQQQGSTRRMCRPHRSWHLSGEPVFGQSQG